MLARKVKEDQGNFGSPGPGVTAYVLGSDRGGKFFPSFPNLCYHRALSHICKEDALCRAIRHRAGLVLTPARERMVLSLRMTVPQFSKSVSPPGARGRSETLVFSYGIFLSTQEVNEWRCRRHEFRSDL